MKVYLKSLLTTLGCIVLTVSCASLVTELMYKCYSASVNPPKSRYIELQTNNIWSSGCDLPRQIITSEGIVEVNTLNTGSNLSTIVLFSQYKNVTKEQLEFCVNELIQYIIENRSKPLHKSNVQNKDICFYIRPAVGLEIPPARYILKYNSLLGYSGSADNNVDFFKMLEPQ